MTLHFFASMTAAPSDFRKIESLLERVQFSGDPLAHVLTTPLFMNKNALDLVRRFQEERGSEICFDSAGGSVRTENTEAHQGCLEC
jgi:hypothetical protein